MATSSAPDETRALVADDGAELAYRRFDATGDQLRGSIVYLHGIQSHGGWYVDTGAELARRGYTVFMPDRRGSGVNAGPRGWFGPHRRLVDDVGAFVDAARRDTDGAPVFLVGGCWGARPALGYATRSPDTIAGIALVCPALRARVDLQPAEKLRVGWGRVFDEHTPIRVPLEPEMFTDQEEYVELIRSDPLALREVTARFYYEMAVWDAVLRRTRELHVPALVLQAADDPIVDVDWVLDWFAKLRVPAKDQVVYEGFGHILDFEPERQRYWDDLAGWLDRRTEAAQRRARARREPASARIVRADVLTVGLPLRFSFGHALASRASTENVVVRLVLDSGHIGYGEGVPRDYVTGETAEGAVSALLERQLPQLVDREISAPDDVPAALGDVPTTAPDGSPDTSARCALELAFLDACGRHFGLSAQHWLGPRLVETPRYDGVVPFASPKKVAALAVVLRGLGFSQVKLKVGDDLERDLACLAVLRRVLGPDADLRVDANCAWTLPEALASIERMREPRISAVEQPLPGPDFEGLRTLTGAIRETVIVDESLRTVAEAEELASTGACGAFNIRVSKCGGLLPSLRIAAIAKQHGLDCVVGAQVGESGILSSAGRLLASTIAPRYLEGSGGSLLLREDITAENLVPGVGGRARMLDSPGLGVHVQEDVLRRLTVSAHSFTTGS